MSEPTTPASPMLESLFDGAGEVGIHGNPARAALWGALTAVLEQVPSGHRRSISDHFPDDVNELFEPRPTVPNAEIHVDSELSLEADAAIRGGITLEEAAALLPRVIHVLRTFIPDHDGEIRSELPPELRAMWSAS